MQYEITPLSTLQDLPIDEQHQRIEMASSMWQLGAFVRGLTFNDNHDHGIADIQCLAFSLAAALVGGDPKGGSTYLFICAGDKLRDKIERVRLFTAALAASNPDKLYAKRLHELICSAATTAHNRPWVGTALSSNGNREMHRKKAAEATSLEASQDGNAGPDNGGAAS